MERQGIEIKLNTTIDEVNVEKGVATGVTLANGELITADVVVSNADAAYLYRRMIKPSKQASATRMKLAAAHYSMGLFVLYFGTTQTYPEVAHHTIWMGPRYRELLEFFIKKH